MKNDWYYILGFEQKGIINDNLAIILEEILNKFIFKEYDIDKNIIVINKTDLKEYKIIIYKKRGNYCFSIETNDNLKEKNEKIRYDFEISRYNYDEINCTSDLLLINSKIRKDVFYKENSYYELIKQKIKYIDDSVNKLENAFISTDKYFLNRKINSKFIIPDLICTTKITKNKNNVLIYNNNYEQQFKLFYNTIMCKSNLPICYILKKEHSNFIDSFNNEDTDIKFNKLGIKKIGF